MGKRKPKTSEVAAIEDLLRRIRIAKLKPDFQELSNLHNQLGNQYRLLGDFESAIEHHQEEINVTKLHNRKDKMGLGIAYRNMGEVYTEMKREAKALTFIKFYLKIAKDVGNIVEEQRACITLGRAYLSMAEKEPSDAENGTEEENQLSSEEALDKAESWFRIAYKLINEDELKSQLQGGEKELMLMKCNNCQNLGLTLEIRGKLNDETTWLIKAIDIGNALEAAKNASKTAKSLGNLPLEVEVNLLEAKALFLMDEIDVGKKNLKRLRQKIRKKDALHGYFEELDPLLTAAVRICRTQDSLYATDEAGKKMKLHEILGDNYTALSNFAVAIAHYKKACDYADKQGIQGKKLSRLYFSIAESYRDLENYSNAHKYYLKEMELNKGNLAEEFKTQTSITLVLEKMNKSAEEVIEAHEKALTMAKLTKNFSKEVTARNNFAIYLKSIGRRNESEHQTQLVNKIKEEHNIGDLEDADSQDLLDDEEEEIDLDDLSEEEESDDEADEERKGERKKFMRRVNEAGETQLHLAAKKGDLKAVRRLIRQGHPVKAKDNAGWTPLHEACNFGHASVVQELLKHGAEVNDAGGALAEKITPLHDAACNGHHDVMKVLLEYGANVLARDSEGRYPIDSLISWRESEPGQNCSEDELIPYREVKGQLKDRMERAGKPYRKEDEKRARKRALRSDTSPKSSLLVTRARDYDCPIPVTIATDSYDPDQEGDGRKLYQNAMKQLRRKDPEVSSTSKKEKPRAMSPGPRGALIPAELDVHEDWLLPDDSIATTSRSTKPKRKRDSMDDVTFDEIGSSRRKSGGNKHRRKSRASFEEDELMDVGVDEPETNSSDVQASESPIRASPSPIPSPEFEFQIGLEDENFVDLCDNDFDYVPGMHEHDDFLPSQRPTTSRSEFGKTVDVQVADDDKENSENDRESPVFGFSRSRKVSISSPSKRSRRKAISSSDDEDNDFSSSGTRNKSSKMQFSRIASAVKSSNLHGAYHQSGGNRKSSNNLIQTRLPVKIISKPKSSRLSDESFVDNRRSSSPEAVYVNQRPTSSVTANTGSQSRQRPKEVWRLKVWIRGKPLLVPVEEDNLDESIDWLASECARRYLETHGVKPILTLQTKDGAILSGADPIRLVLDADGRELEGVVASFDLPPLVDRYCSACAVAAIEPDSEVKSNLNLCQSSNVLNLTDVNLRAKAGELLMTALQRQSSLSTLVLSGCSLFDGGILELCKVLPTLSGLTYLDLSSNGITKNGFAKFCEVFCETGLQTDALSSGSKIPLGLGITTLILSHNPIGNFVGSNLASLLTRLIFLKRLEIADCNFTEKLFTWSRSDLTKAFSNSRLEELDISYNNLKEVGMEKCLQSLPARKIRVLNCSSSATTDGPSNSEGSKDAVAKAVCSFLSRNEDCCNLTTLKLNDCGLNDKSMELILDTFDRLVRLENLELVCNDELTASSLTNILSRSVDREVPLARLDMGSIPHLWKSSTPTPEMILSALEQKMSANKRLVFLRFPTEVQLAPVFQNQSQQEISKLESGIVSLMEDFAGSTNFSYKKQGACVIYQFDD